MLSLMLEVGQGGGDSIWPSLPTNSSKSSASTCWPSKTQDTAEGIQGAVHVAGWVPREAAEQMKISMMRCIGRAST